MDVGTIRLSTEELALVLAQAGQAVSSRQLIASRLGRVPSEAEFEAITLTAAHGLLASNGLALDTDGGMLIDPALQRIAGVFTAAELSLRLSRAEEGGERLATYHVTGAGALEHLVEYGTVHVLRELAHRDAVLDAGVDFFGVADAAPFTAAPFALPLAALSGVASEHNAESFAQRLQQSGVPAASATLLAEDLAGAQYRGSALRVEYDEGQPISEQGLLLLRGPRRLWLIRHGDQKVTLMAGTVEAFRREVAPLLQPGRLRGQ
jgi:hypothetical protein